MSNQRRGTQRASDFGRAGRARFSRAGFSPRLFQRLTECVTAMATLEKIFSPIIPYIAAWREHEKIIWYEHVGARFLALLGCNRGEVDEVFRQSIAALWSSHPTRPPGLATPPPLFFLASSFCEPIAPYTAAHDPTP